MDEISQSNESIMAQINESNQKMGEIVRVIQEIGNKTKVINEIVFQTKLLSFNASVEAARAGEHGKGFAVVAEEVGNLAQMSGNAAKEISDMLDGSISKVDFIVNETKSKVEHLVAQGKGKVESGVRVARQCSDVLNEIVHNVSKVSTLSQEISQASKEQAQGVTEINKAMGQLDTVNQQNTTTSQEASTSAQQLSSEAVILKGIVEDLVYVVQGRRADNFENNKGLHQQRKNVSRGGSTGKNQHPNQGRVNHHAKGKNSAA
jgi:methyl-accepting chemotaxis protein